MKTALDAHRVVRHTKAALNPTNIHYLPADYRSCCRWLPAAPVIRPDWNAMRRFHIRRGFSPSLPPEQRRWHRRTAQEISARHLITRHYAGDWKSWCEAWRA
jgi:hypothetical protein